MFSCLTMKYILFLLAIVLETRPTENKNQINGSSKALTVSPVTYTTFPGSLFCLISQNEINNDKILLIPTKEKYYHMDKVIYSCKSGYYLQKPKVNTLIAFENVCINGSWKVEERLKPVCGSTCQQWNHPTNRWQAIVINASIDPSGYIISPGYPGNMLDTISNCSYFIESKSQYIKLIAVEFNLRNFYFEIQTNNETYFWSQNTSNSQTLSVTGYGSIKIFLRKYEISTIANGKIENYKLLYENIENSCKTFMGDRRLMINRTKLANNGMMETYSCRYPYSLIGTPERRCLLGKWKTFSMPICKFLCNSDKQLAVNEKMEMEVMLEKSDKCRLRISGGNSKMIIKIDVTRSDKAESRGCLYIKKNFQQRTCFNGSFGRFYFVPPINISFEKEMKEKDQVFKVHLATMKTGICSTPSPIENGFIQFRSTYISSVAHIFCEDFHFLKGSNKIKCDMENSGLTFWKYNKKTECIKLCSNHWKIVEIEKNSYTVSVPLFFRLNFSENQICRWTIKSFYISPIISITSTNKIKDFVNITVQSGKNKVDQSNILLDTFSEVKDSMQMLYFCPDKVCNLSLLPLYSLNEVQESFSVEIKIFIADNVSSVNYQPGIFIFILLMTVLCFMIFLIFYDYSRHPYTGYLAKFMDSFKRSNIKRITAFSVFGSALTRPFSKTETEIIVFYNARRSNRESVDIRRSLSCSEDEKNIPKFCKQHFVSVKRRFSDITDMVFIRCSKRTGKEERKNEESTNIEAINLSFKCDEEG